MSMTLADRLTSTGTNLLGLIKHLTIAEARYFGAVFGRPFPERLPWWDDDADFGTDMWATEAESRAEIVDRYRRAWEHSDATIAFNLRWLSSAGSGIRSACHLS
jgi:hypothetical protein